MNTLFIAILFISLIYIIIGFILSSNCNRLEAVSNNKNLNLYQLILIILLWPLILIVVSLIKFDKII